MSAKNLDASHRCLLDHLETFRRMESSYREIDSYIGDVLLSLSIELNRQESFLQFNAKTIARNWLDAEYRPNWKGTKLSLVAIGIESLAVESIVPSTVAERCLSYVYSPYYE